MRHLLTTMRPVALGVAIGMSMLVLSAATVWATVKAYKAQSQVKHITEIVQGTPGPQGEPGIGVERVVVRHLPAGAQESASLSHGILVLRIPEGERGPMGPQGERGRRGAKGEPGNLGPRGARGEEGEQGAIGLPGKPATPEQMNALLREFFKNHSLRCTFVNVKQTILECQIIGLGG